MRVITQAANGFQTSIQRTAGDEWRFVVTPATREHEARAAACDSALRRATGNSWRYISYYRAAIDGME